jgi:hypothetical protein
VRALNIIEQRLGDTDEAQALSARGRIMYTLMRGDNYYGMLRGDTNQERRRALILRAMESYEAAEMLAREENLNEADPMFLSCIYARCRGFFYLKRDASASRRLAHLAFHAAAVHMELGTVSVELLQKLRDEFINNHKPPGMLMGDEDATDTGTDTTETSPLELEPPTLTAEEEEQALLASMPRGVSAEDWKDPATGVVLSPYALAIVQKLRRQVHKVESSRLDKLERGHAFSAALNSIFKAYVRGNAMPGQYTYQHNKLGVGVGGSSTTMDQFMLGGPYLSWKGFVMFLRDFNLARRPSGKMLSSQRFPGYLWNNAQPVTHPAPLDMDRATALFIEAAKTSQPALMVARFEKRYKEIQEGMVIDPWIEVGIWLDTQDWQIEAGLNFGQFCDTLAKMGVVIFSSSLFDEALPEFADKVNHFFTATLKLLDEDYWQKRVERKISSFKLGTDTAGDPNATTGKWPKAASGTASLRAAPPTVPIMRASSSPLV